MKQSTQLFLFFLVTVSVCLVALIYLELGPQLTKETLNIQDRTSPIVVMRLDKLSSTASSEEFLSLIYEPRLLMLVAADGKTILSGRVSFIPVGRTEQEWDFISIIRIRQSVSYVKTITSPEYQLIDDDSDSVSENLSFEIETTSPAKIKQRVVILLCEVPNDYVNKLNGVLNQSLSPFQGLLLWNAPLVSISPFSTFDLNFFAVIQFASNSELMDWINSEQRKTEFAIATEFVEHLTLLVVDPL